MSLLKILHYGHPLLREKAKDLKQVGTREKELIKAMEETMYHAKGIGLAAPQVGVMERLFVLDVDQRNEDGEETDGRRLQVFINPEIVWESDEDDTYKEGCLSIPGIHRDVYRPVAVKVVARDENFEEFSVDADDLLARVIQHEYDHLNGVMFIDHLSRVSRALIGSELNRIKKEALAEYPNLPADYPITVG